MIAGWIVFALACIALIYWFVVRGAKVSTKISVALGTIEILILGVLSLWLIIAAGGRNTLSVFGTGHTPSGYKGLSGVIAGSVYTVLAFSDRAACCQATAS